MKKTIAIVVLALTCTAAFAQRAPQSSSYKDLKNVYSSRNYSRNADDPYSIFWIGLESFGAPGTGQLIMKETGRGVAFLGTSIVISATAGVLSQNLFDLAEKDSNGKWEIPEANKDKADKYLVAIGALMVAQLGVDICSCIDAVKIAKVKNQYYQDLQGRKNSYSATLHPSFDVAQTGNSSTITAGMTLAVKF